MLSCTQYIRSRFLLPLSKRFAASFVTALLNWLLHVQIVISTLRNAVELLEGDGSVPASWPIEMSGVAFHASPATHDVDGDGVLVRGVAGVNVHSRF